MNAFDPDTMRELDFEGIGLNTDDKVILAQVNENIRRGLPQARPYQPQPNQIIALVCGGPSLADTEKELVEAVWRGAKVATVNAAYNWCIDRNIRPSMQIMLDAREFSARFVERPVDGCQYFLASQCHPRAFEHCRGRSVTLLHVCSTGDGEHEMLKEFYFDRVNPITIGTTVAIRGLSLLRMLGFLRFDIFGLDSCILGDEHHAYAQAENNADPIIPVWLTMAGQDPQGFFCHPWMAKQATDFIDLVKERGDQFQARVRGPGLIATMIERGATLVTEDVRQVESARLKET